MGEYVLCTTYKVLHTRKDEARRRSPRRERNQLQTRYVSSHVRQVRAVRALRNVSLLPFPRRCKARLDESGLRWGLPRAPPVGYHVPECSRARHRCNPAAILAPHLSPAVPEGQLLVLERSHMGGHLPRTLHRLPLHAPPRSSAVSTRHVPEWHREVRVGAGEH
jgi:hypothetical protein